MPIDSAYQELIGEYPELFPNTYNQADQLEKILDVATMLQPRMNGISSIGTLYKEVFYVNLNNYLEQMDLIQKIFLKEQKIVKIAKDLPRAKQDKAIKYALMGMFKLFVDAWSFNRAFEFFCGCRLAFDSIDREFSN